MGIVLSSELFPSQIAFPQTKLVIGISIRHEILLLLVYWPHTPITMARNRKLYLRVKDWPKKQDRLVNRKLGWYSRVNSFHIHYIWDLTFYTLQQMAPSVE